ncbi:hypothetical protein COCON_G00085630 [Conger conger]|uniref:Drebrin n=1 Tax=Conger conger TaxID=82655 RepID=A0A9Q1DR94_CONCO|nr:hypothetical protein COCON_G00085630 [Conger conger]
MVQLGLLDRCPPDTEDLGLLLLDRCLPENMQFQIGLDDCKDSNMAVNLGKHRLDLLTAYQDVIDENSSTDWALYSHEGDSNDLILASCGGGGLAEIAGAVDQTRVMYGFCSMKEPNSALPRYILINWVGEDVPDARKCSCASHVATVAEFFQGVDIIINASSVEDMDPSAVGQRLSNGLVAVASPVLNRLRLKDEEQAENVGTKYQKTNAEVEMKKINREEFWEQAKREEELRKEAERKKLAEERQRFEEERMELEKKEQEDRERRYREKEEQIEEHRKKLQEEEEAWEKIRNQTLITVESCDDASDKRETEVEEAAAIIAQRTDNPREFFKQKEMGVATSVDSSPVSTHRTENEGRSAHGVTGDSSPIPKIITTPNQEPDDSLRERDSEPPHSAPVQETPQTKPTHSVAPQARDTSQSNASDSLLDLWETGATPGPAPPSCFDEPTPAGTVEMSSQHALQQEPGSQEQEESQLLMTNGEAFLKEGTQASEGYFSQSQEEEFAQSEDCSAKVNPSPVFYSKPPEIDITCWDTDPVMEDED